MYESSHCTEGSVETDPLQLADLRPTDTGRISISSHQLHFLGAELKVFVGFLLGVDSQVRTMQSM